MADIELDNLGEDTDRVEEEQHEQREEEDTSFAENIEKIAEFDDIQTKINSNRLREGLRPRRTRVDLNDLESQIQDHAVRKAIQRYNAIQVLETATDTRFSVTHGDSSKELIDYISDAKYNENGGLTALKFKGEDIKLTGAGKIDKRYEQNKGILKAIDKAKAEYIHVRRCSGECARKCCR